MAGLLFPVRAVAAIALFHIAAQAWCGHPPVASFTENRGQWPSQVLYRTLVPGGVLFVEQDAFTVSLHSGGPLGHRHGDDAPEQPFHAQAYRVRFLQAQPAKGTGSAAQPHYENFFLGNDPAHWAGHCLVFGAVRLDGLYPGIRLRVDGATGLKYDLLLDPGADPALIQLGYEGQDRLELKDGRIVVTTSAGTVTEEAPVAYQPIGRARRSVACRYALKNGRVSFEFPEGYDRRYPLVIDPELTFSSYTGSAADNFGFTASYDDAGHLYGGGIVFGNGYPLTVGVQDPSFNGGRVDIGLTKFSPDGTSLIWSTYLGGSMNETPHSLVVNSAEELYVLGVSGSNDFPTTASAYDRSFNGGTAVVGWPGMAISGYGFSHPQGTDITVTHFAADAASLVASSYVGGSRNDGLNNAVALAHNYGDHFRGEITLDQQQWPLVATSTESSDIPISGNAPQRTFGGGAQDAYFFRMDPALSTLQGTFFGGSGDDSGYGIQLDRNGEPYMTGGTTSPDLPMAGNPLKAQFGGGVDGYVAHYSPTGTSLLGSTYIGTNAYDQCYFVQLNTGDQVFVVGQTHGNYPCTPGKYVNPGSSQFIQKLSHDLSTSLWSTVIGTGSGREDISPSAFLVSNCDQIYFSGWGGSVNHFGQATQSTTTGLPVSANAFQSTTDGSDFYLMLLNADATVLEYATFFGGPAGAEHVDGGTSRFDKKGSIYQAVCAGCGGHNDFPTTPGAWSPGNGSSNCNLGVIKFNLNAVSVAPDTMVCRGESVVLGATGGVSYAWTPAGSLDDATSPTPRATPLDTTLYHVAITTGEGCTINDSIRVNVQVHRPAPMLTDTVVCLGDSVRIAANDANRYAWRAAPGITDLLSATPMVTPPAPMYYAVAATNMCGTAWDSLFVDVQHVVAIAWSDTICPRSVAILHASGGVDYAWSPPELVTATDVGTAQAFPDAPTTYSVMVSNALGCFDTATVRVELFPEASVSAGEDVTIPYGHSALLHAYGNGTIHWDASPDLSCDSCARTMAAPLSTTTYTARIVDAHGCLASDAVTVFVEGSLFVPNTFTPNGDGINDRFFALATEAKELRLWVFNRWGEMIYEGTGTTKAWDGTYKGVDSPIDTYVWRVELLERSGEHHTFYGHVNLLR
ncbi:MAG: gliding motility-associated C-terminal domain-containing protein [Flavobacteriales bacterium]